MRWLPMTEQQICLWERTIATLELGELRQLLNEIQGHRGELEFKLHMAQAELDRRYRVMHDRKSKPRRRR